jgi:hypothetical protein
MTDVRRRLLTLVAVFGLVALLDVTGCGNRQPASTRSNGTVKPAPSNGSGPWIKADPNPVAIPAGAKQVATTLSWDTGDGSDAQVYLRVSGKPDQLFSGGPRNKAEAGWIRAGVNFEFILFAGKEHQRELARVTVTATR